jgi:acetyl-CoA acetyltransferase
METRMARHSWELVQTMRAALDEVVTKIPADRTTSGVKAKVAEVILQAAAKGQTSHQGLMRAALDQIHTIISELT